MTTDFDYTLPPAIRRISGSFRVVGWISFWVQIVLAAISSLVLMFALVNLSARSGGTANPGTGVGLLFAALGLVAVYLSAFWAFRYTQLGRRLRSRDIAKRPSPKDALQALRLGTVVSMVGMLITLFGSQALIGSLLGKALAQPQGGTVFVPGNINQYVEAFDIFVVQANTNTLLAHFVSLSATLWLLRMVNRA
ncbi:MULTISPECIES: DUF3611 family protein [Cyanophyceae]|uniref:DUF3611 family protein n=1 Tax=Cyanophyceae TaxID=3028117 RepID=UPI001689EF3C|nr:MULTISPECIES: DUF3611 family protein [Cyanophyceae]MBD1916894.1 DUF3611 family protein [Phormidium sp. FACHB-77]MBD2029900.1 DUF3611 family protein [Phormidium sp. FACHB-322]MBD2053096.1 DUF3611 family protein [Leptolyngbya sp. FACHB-60]